MSRSLEGTKQITSIYISANKKKNGEYKLQMFKCHKCGIPVFQYKGHIVSMTPGSAPCEVKVVVKCKGNYKNEQEQWEECSMLYEFLGTSEFVPSDTIQK